MNEKRTVKRMKYENDWMIAYCTFFTLIALAVIVFMILLGLVIL